MHPALRVRPPALHVRLAGGAGAAAAARRPAPHLVLPARTTASASTRTACARALRPPPAWGRRGEVGALRGHAAARAHRPRAQRLPLPGLLLRRSTWTSCRSSTGACASSATTAPNVLTFRDADHLGPADRPVKENVRRLPRRPRHRPGRRAGRAAHQPAAAGPRVQPGQLLLLLRRRRVAGRDRGRGGQHVRRAPPLPADRREPGARRVAPGVRAPQADARLAVLRHGPDVPVLVHGAGRAGARGRRASSRAASARSGPS